MTVAEHSGAADWLKLFGLNVEFRQPRIRTVTEGFCMVRTLCFAKKLEKGDRPTSPQKCDRDYIRPA